MALRSTTNLVVDQHLQLDPPQMKQGFMYVYRGLYPGPEPVFMQKLWLSHFFPDIVQDPSFGKDRKALRNYTQFAEKYQQAGLLKIKKVNDPKDPHFVVAVPVFEAPIHSLQDRMYSMRKWFTNVKTEHDLTPAEILQNELKNEAESGDLVQKQVMAAEIIPKMGLDSNGTLALRECFFGVRVQYYGGLAVVFADFKIKKEEAQQLTSTEWLMIRNMDIYPLLLHWQVSLWGYKGTAPTSSFPVSKIAKTLPPVHESQARVSEFGLSISPDGAPLWLPEKLDNTQRYEDLYAQVGDKGDDTFGILELKSASTALSTGKELKVNLPENIPVLIDWVNNRFAYTQSNGVLKVQDLSRFKAADHAHAKNLLTNWKMSDDQAMAILHMAETAGVKDALFFTEEEADAIADEDPVVASKLVREGGITVEEYWPIATAFHKRFVDEKRFVLADLSIEGPPIWRPFARFVDQAQAAVLNNLDAVNTKYSVSGTINRLGIMTLIAKYGNDLTRTYAKANAIMAAAQNQGVDPKWSPPSVPLIMDNPERPFSLLPHQAKVRNIMKDDPDFAILPVQAGGGKTPLTIIDVLMQIKKNTNAPYLIMCPSALVPQYVKEVTHFTSGKVNVIPIVSDVLFRNGPERLTKMIETAPRNTLVVVNYDVLRNGAYDVCYGTTNVKVYPVIEFLRQFNFGYVMCDEAHFLKNDSQRTRAAQILIADIPKKRLASGTMAHDSPSDLAMQIAMLDPTVFGNREAFNKRFGANVKGDRVIEWHPGAQQDIMHMIKSRIVVAKAMRKEWAALLPTAIDLIHRCEMTDAQRTVYQTILEEAFDKMEEDAKSNPALKKFLENRNGAKPAATPQKPGGDEGLDEEADEEAEDDADEEAGEATANLLKFYLARVEQFLTAPGKDELGARVLKGKDLRSAKVNKILEIIKDHITRNLPGKCLVFTNFVESAEEIYEAASEDPILKASGILYTAANKVEDGAAFETSAKVKWMVGVETSMNTGLNFQFVSRLIRVETVWNPGTLEQGNSRINRPEMKKADERPSIYYDTIVTNHSIDITKAARLISKIIAVSKFENTDNPAYETIPDVDIIPMSAEAIMSLNDWDSNLVDYMKAYKKHNTVRHDDYEAYKKKVGGLTLTPLKEAPMPKDAALMAEVPYVPGLEVFRGSERGLIRVDEYLRQSASDDVEGKEEKDAEDAKSEAQRKRLELAMSLKGQPVHTEFGDGIIKSVAFGSKLLNVLYPTGYMMRIRFSAAFVITKKASRKKMMREQILKGISDKMPIAAPTGILGPRFRVDNRAAQKQLEQEQEVQKQAVKKQKQRESEAQMIVELHLNVSNGFLGVTYYPEEGAAATAALQALGFRPVEPYVFAEMPTHQHVLKLFDKWSAAGFQMDKKFAQTNAVAAITDLARVLKNGAVRNGALSYRFANRNQLQNFMRMEVKPSTSTTAIKPFPMIEEGAAYIVMHTRGQPATKAAMRVKVPGVVWQEAADSFVYFGLDPNHIARKLKEVQAAGIQISNIEELRTQFAKLKTQKLRNSEE